MVFTASNGYKTKKLGGKMYKVARSILTLLVSMVLLHSVAALANTDVDIDKVDKDKIKKEVRVEIESDGPGVEIIVPVAFFMTFPACMFLLFLFRYKSTREKQITLRTMVENGANIPPEMFLDGKGQVSPIEKDRKYGILFTLGSAGLIVFLLAVTTQKGLWSIGLVPLLIGVGYLINWKLGAKVTEEVEVIVEK